MSGGASVTVLDGHASIGGTKILLETGARSVLLDFGTNYRRQGEIYEEYLRPRPARGLTDLLAVGLLPERRGFYRSDLFPPADYPELDARFPGPGRPDALLLTHAHLDHCGALAFLDPGIPVYASPATLATLRAVQETGAKDLASETTYLGERRAASGTVLESARGARKIRRSWRLFGEVPTPLSVALSAPISERQPLEGPLPAPAADDLVRELAVRAPEVDHSLLGSNAFLLDVDGARVAYTGDLRFHGGRAKETEAFLRELEARRPDVLLVEGTRLRRPGDTAAQTRTSEESVRENALRVVADHADRFVIADFGPRNIERLITFRSIADEVRRHLVITAKDAYLLRLLSTVDPRVPADFGANGFRIWTEPSAARANPWLTRLHESAGSAFIDASEIVDHPGRWLVCFSFFDANDLVDLRRGARGGLWLYSSSEAHGEEQEFDFRRLRNWIEWAGMHAVGFEVDAASGAVRFPGGFHASGHATEDELVDLVRRAGARKVVPVHSESPQRYQELLGPEGATVDLPVAGRPIAVG